MDPRTSCLAVSSVAALCMLSGCALERATPRPLYASPLLAEQTHGAPDEHAARAALARGEASSRAPARRRSRPRPTPRRRSAPPRDDTRRPQTAPTTPALATRRRPAAPAPSAAPAARPDPDEAAAARFVAEALARQGFEVGEQAHSSLRALHTVCKKRGRMHFPEEPAPGQAVFFHNTGDRNADGRNNDWYTHAALVEDVDALGTVTLVTRRGARKVRFVMNLKYPGEATTESGAPLNDQLRPRKEGDVPYTQYLAGELYAGACRP